MQPGDRLVVVFVKPQPVGKRFTEWPLHVTIVPWFRARISEQDLAAQLSEQLRDMQPFTVTAGKDARFGYRESKTVSLIEGETPLRGIESLVRRTLKSYNAWIADETTKRRRSFQPHVTAQASGRLHESDTFLCDRMSIVEQNGEYKEVIQEVNFHER